MRKAVWSAIFFLAFLACSPLAHAGKIVLDNDEWTLSNFGFAQAGTQPGTFALNVAQFFTGGSPGTFLVYSSNFGLTQSALASTMTGAGHTWTINSALPFTLPNLLAFNGVFLALPPATYDPGVLTTYVNAGGNVYIAAGTGVGGPAFEAAHWNTFLNNFNLAFDGTAYNGIRGNISISSAHPLFAGVTALYQNNGNSILDLAPVDPRVQVLVTFGGEGLYAVFDSGGETIPTNTPTGTPTNTSAATNTPTQTSTNTSTSTSTNTPTDTPTGTATPTNTPTNTPANKCPLTQGFWKNHPAAWSVTSLTLGSQTYTQAELLTILAMPVGSRPTGSDASLILAHQLIAAKLNIAHGSDPAAVGSAIADADSLLSTFSGKLPYKVKTSSVTGQAMVTDANVLDRYNSGLFTPNCLS